MATTVMASHRRCAGAAATLNRTHAVRGRRLARATFWPTSSRLARGGDIATALAVGQPKKSVVALGLMDNIRQSWGGSITEDDEPRNPIEAVTDDNFEDFIKGNGDELIVCQFTADWCKPCQKIRPMVRKMAYAHTNVCFGSYNCDKAKPQLPKSQGVNAFPAFVLYKSGEKIGQLKGATCTGELMAIVASHDIKQDEQ